MKVVIIGGVAGGATAAARIRRLGEQAEIVVFERSGFISYANCGLPYYIGGVIEDKEDLTLQTPDSFFGRFRVDMRVCHEVLSIDSENKFVIVKNLKTGEEFKEAYDKLLISTGAKPVKPAFEGVTKDNIFTLRTVEDTLRIKEYVDTNHPGSVVVAGGGFIGLEAAENLRGLGMEVTIVQGPFQLMPPFDYDMAAFIHGEVRRYGIDLLLKRRVVKLEERSDKTQVILDDGSCLVADMVILALGVTPDTALVKDTGMALGVKGSIVVNDKMETSVPDIYAADNICGGDSRYTGGQGSSIIKVFNLTAAVTGINERVARESGIDSDKVILSPMSHAGYYPGGKIMTMKVLFEKETYRLLGAQIIGYEGVDKRIDVLATAIRAGIRADELHELDLAYAPPYSSAKDPVNMAGYIIENIKNGIVKQWYYEEVEKLPRDGSVILLDTRTAREYGRGHIEGFVNIPVDDLRDRQEEIEKGKPVYVICQSGLRSYIASRILAGNGYDVYNFAGGYRFYDAVRNDRELVEKSTSCGMDA